MRVKTVVFDLGGVLFTEGKSVALEVLSQEHGYDPAIVMSLLTCKRSRDMRKGTLAEKTFWTWAAGQVPAGYDVRLIRDEWYRGYVRDPDVFSLATRLRGDYRLVVFSENIPDRVAYLDEKYDFRELFDTEIYSYDHQAGKRDPRFHQVLLEILGDRPEEILYIDNARVPLALAERLGVNAVQYTTGQIDTLEAAMERFGVQLLDARSTTNRPSARPVEIALQPT